MVKTAIEMQLMKNTMAELAEWRSGGVSGLVGK